MNKLKVESLKVNVLKALQLKKAKADNKYKDDQVYIQEPDEMIQNFEDIQNLKESKQDKLRAGNSITISSDNEINAEIDLSQYHTKTQTAKLFMGRDETYTKEEIDEKTGMKGLRAGENISVVNENGKPKISSTIAYKLKDKIMSIGNTILGKGTAVGVNASATGENSVALGADSVATLPNQVSVGNSETKRIISNVADGVELNDVVTVGQFNKKISAALDQLNRLASQLYPVGSIYMNVNNVEPSAIFGGTWEKMPAGRMLVNSSDDFALGQIGGEKEHRLTEDELAAHNHSVGGEATTSATTSWADLQGGISACCRPNGSSDGIKYLNGGGIVTKESEYWITAKNGGDSTPGRDFHINASHNHTIDVASLNLKMTTVGKNQPHNNMPPYIVVNMWKRIS